MSKVCSRQGQGDGDLQTKVAGPPNLAMEGRSKRSHWCSLAPDCLPSTIMRMEVMSSSSTFIVLHFVRKLTFV